MLDLGRRYFNRDGRLAASEILDPFVVAQNPQRLGDRLVTDTNFNCLFNFPKIETGDFARLQGNIDDLSYSFFSSSTGPAKRSSFSVLF